MKKDIINKRLMTSISIIVMIFFIGTSVLSGVTCANDLEFSKPVEQRPPPKPIITGITEGCININYEYCTTANFGCPYVYYRFDWDADGSGDITDWYGPYYNPLVEECCKTCLWDTKGTYTVRSQVKASCGHTGPWSDPLYVEIYKSSSILSYDSSSYNFGIILEGQTFSTTFEIWNSGVDELVWSLSDNYNWLTYEPNNGISTGEHDIVTVYIDTTGLEGSYTGDIVIESNGGSSIFDVIFDVHIPVNHHVYPDELIQNAIDDACCGDTIYVHDDNGNHYIYNENININKRITLIGDDVDTVTIQASNTEINTVYITTCDVSISNFTITGSYECGFAGICLEEVNNCKIFNCNCRENLCAGIFLINSNNCEIIDNIVSNNDCGGIKLFNSNYNTITGNIITDNINMGMNIYGGSSNNLIYNNYFDNPIVNAIDNVPWSNIWNITKTSGINIIGGPYLGGNYWGDYNGVDNNIGNRRIKYNYITKSDWNNYHEIVGILCIIGDGIGNILYDIKNADGNEITNNDYLPLVTQYHPLIDDCLLLRNSNNNLWNITIKAQ